MAVDIDGTLLNDDKKISNRVKNAIVAAQKKGVRFAIASGRAIYGIMSLAQELEFSKYGGYVLSFNGGKIVNCATGEELYNRCLPHEVIPEICRYGKEYGVNAVAFDNDLVVEDDKDKYVLIESKLIGRTPKKVESIAEYITAPVNKMLLVGDPEILKPLEIKTHKVFKNRLSVYRSEPYFLEFLPLGIDKAKTLEELIGILGIEQSELMVIGDGYNDLSMIEFAGLGVAMENAQEEVKQAADFVTLSNQDDGVAYALERYLLK